jgi:predicted ATPase
MWGEQRGWACRQGISRQFAAVCYQHARSLELRATASLVRFLRRQGRNDEARGLLAPIFGWFTEGFDTADLREAKALLDEIG